MAPKKLLNVLFVFDQSPTIGAGHAARCRVLAASLERVSACVHLLENPLSKEDLPGLDAFDWVVLDSYRFDHHWERWARQRGCKVLTIDDAPKRAYECDVLLDPNMSREGVARWQSYVSSWTDVRAGAPYLLLRDEFLCPTDAQPDRLNSGGARIDRPRLLVSMGGADAPGVAGRVMRALLSDDLRHRIEVLLIAGALNPHADLLQNLCMEHPHARFIRTTAEMASILRNCDLCVGAGGTSQWERSYLECPSLVVTLADNQREAVDYLAEVQAVHALGWHEDLTEQTVVTAVTWALDYPEKIRLMAQRAKALVGEPELVRNPRLIFE